MANYKIQMKKKVGASTYDNLYPVTRAEYVTGLEKYKMREATDVEYASTSYLNYAKVYFLQKSTDGGTTYTDVVDSNNLLMTITGILEPQDAPNMVIREYGIYDNEGDLLIVSRYPDYHTMEVGMPITRMIFTIPTNI